MWKVSILICFVSLFSFVYSDCINNKKFEDYFEHADKFDSSEIFGDRSHLYKSSQQAFVGSPHGAAEEVGQCAKHKRCIPPVQCPGHVHMKHGGKPQRCRLNKNEWGYCCSKDDNRSVQLAKKFRKDRRQMFQDVLLEARQMAENLTQRTNHVLEKDNPNFLHQLTLQGPFINPRKESQLSKWALEQILMGKLTSEREQTPPNEVFEMVTMNDENSICVQLPKCSSTRVKYRTANGICNNPLSERGHWGAAGQPMERLLFPAYEDGIWSPRLHSVDGSPLTSARRISRILLPDFDRPNNVYNSLFMQFGQFISHDFVQSSTIRTEDGRAIQCCTSDGSRALPPEELHFGCLPIEIDPDDEFYGPFNQGCMNFVRLSLAPYPNCRIGFGKQISKVTHYLDASQVYGSSLKDQHLLRSFQQGRLQLFPGPNGDMLPITTRSDSCEGTGEGKVCYLSGDGRTNLIISLTLLHTTFAREHNRIANILARINPQSAEEHLFQEARRILIAELQHIIYGEYLPLLIGSSAMQRFQLYPEKSGYSADYDPDINPAAMNEITAAAFRFGHSTVDGLFKIRMRGSEENIEIPDVMFDPGRLEQPGFLTALMVTLLQENMQRVDNSITRGLSVFMFRGNRPFGVDLAATNIQRGRDHGLRSFNDYLELIGKRRIESFEEFGPIASRLRQVYNHPDDIDLWIGGLLEHPINDAAVGQLFAEMIGEQFSRFKRGDRYFYSHHPKINPGHFTPCQLREIRKVSLARIICDNIQSISQIQRFAFIESDFPGNQLVSCEELPKIDFSCWMP